MLLVTDRGILTEMPAMLVFVAQSFPKADLALMNDPFTFAQVQVSSRRAPYPIN